MLHTRHINRLSFANRLGGHSTKMTDSRSYKRTVLREHLRSERLGEDRGLRFFLPPGYDERISYPVVYCQDGEQFFNFGRIATMATELILEHNMEPFIVAGIDVDVKTRTAEYSPEGERFTDYCAFIAEELIPYTEQRFSTRSAADDRVAAGDSLGGTVSLHLALDDPQLFRRVLSFSGAFLASTQTRIARETDLTGLDMYMLIGLQETEVETSRGTFDFLESNRETYRLLQERGASIAYREEEGKHIWGFWQKYMADALRHFFRQTSVR